MRRLSVICLFCVLLVGLTACDPPLTKGYILVHDGRQWKNENAILYIHELQHTRHDPRGVDYHALFVPS